MPFLILNQDITTIQADAIVNAANEGLQMGGGVCGAIFRAAGAQQLQAACDAIGHCSTGQAVLTPAFNLPANYVIHTVGPVWQGGGRGEEQLLAACYLNSLALALEHDCQSVAFPLISAGIFGYPPDQALDVARRSIQAFLKDHDISVVLTLYPKPADTIRPTLQHELDDFLQQQELEVEDFSLSRAPTYAEEVVLHKMASAPPELDDVIKQAGATFSEQLLKLIDAQGLTDAQVYKRANLDRRLFSKIRTEKEYRPSKATAIALAIALHLTLPEAQDLLARAGYALSHSSRFDLIIEYFIRNGRYDIFEINDALFFYQQPLLGA